MRSDLINKIKNFDEFTNYKIKYKICERYNLFGSWHQLIIKYKKKNSLFYSEIVKNLENFIFAFTDVITLSDYHDNDDLKIFQYLKNHPEDNVLEDIVKYCVKKEIDKKRKEQHDSKIAKVPLKWLFYTQINTDKSE